MPNLTCKRTLLNCVASFTWHAYVSTSQRHGPNQLSPWTG